MPVCATRFYAIAIAADGASECSGARRVRDACESLVKTAHQLREATIIWRHATFNDPALDAGLQGSFGSRVARKTYKGFDTPWAVGTAN